MISVAHLSSILHMSLFLSLVRFLAGFKTFPHWAPLSILGTIDLRAERNLRIHLVQALLCTTLHIRKPKPKPSSYIMVEDSPRIRISRVLFIADQGMVSLCLNSMTLLPFLPSSYSILAGTVLLFPILSLQNKT